ncbi:hypothetical protein L596_019416 [Steinernema carpocapsae]|uniref:7TM GPCR serpentine receptor class x (Srx) domain-containing protein n=1 Tax=Steinernema carpocapsae TaxID=34508 RepID=A0A4U5MQL0_STECR|nr:hypothetical protein L596_019416 [Steinernema carpocapsae]
MLVSFARTEIMLTLLLALDRLKIIIDLRYPMVIHKILNVLGWAFGLIHFGILLTPLADFGIVQHRFLPRFDLSKPASFYLSKIGSLELTTMTIFTFLVYVAIFLFLIKKQIKLKYMKTTAFSRQKWILLNAVLKFCGDGSLAVLYHFGSYFLPPDVWVEYAMSFAYAFNFLVLSPTLYILLNR